MPDLYTGTTKSGKTTLARFNARRLCAAGHTVIVRDPVLETATAGGDWGDKARVYKDDQEFMEALLDNILQQRPAYIFIDECADLFKHNMTHNFWIATRGRHYGLHVSFITQRPKLVSPSVRSQCDRVYMFRLNRADRREVLADCGHDHDILNSPLDNGDFLMLNSGSAAFKRANVFQLINPRK